MSWERQIHLTTPWLRVTPTKETSCINEPRQQLWENDCVQFHAVATWSTHSRTSSTWPWFISAGLWCLKWRKSLLSHGQGHPALRRSLHGKQRPWHSKNSLCFESRRVCIPALLLFFTLRPQVGNWFSQVAMWETGTAAEGCTNKLNSALLSFNWSLYKLLLVRVDFAFGQWKWVFFVQWGKFGVF